MMCAVLITKAYLNIEASIVCLNQASIHASHHTMPVIVQESNYVLAYPHWNQNSDLFLQTARKTLW